MQTDRLSDGECAMLGGGWFKPDRR